MIVRLAREDDLAGFLELAGQVEHWFGAAAHDAGLPGPGGGAGPPR
ncbi:hypothetical protein [Nocardia abscessus]|nr:hypothetical protein [Nocardia abscessus]